MTPESDRELVVRSERLREQARAELTAIRRCREQSRALQHEALELRAELSTVARACCLRARRAVAMARHKGSLFRILLVDDDDRQRYLGRRFLTRLGYEVTTACDGSEALRAVWLAAFDLILMDVMMPGMDGFEVTARIRSFEAMMSERSVILAYTSLDWGSAAKGCEGSGMDGHLPKPAGPGELEAAVESVRAGTMKGLGTC
jgi:CheY-like chemotaxis protein